jgi:hypothetical protein
MSEVELLQKILESVEKSNVLLEGVLGVLCFVFGLKVFKIISQFFKFW